jgi:transcriptional regulator with XRE-family HTH domain
MFRGSMSNGFSIRASFRGVRVTVNEAVRALRQLSQKSQQVFATELGMSIRALHNYEQFKRPEAGQLFRFERAAVDAGRLDLARVFRQALEQDLGIVPPGEIAVFNARDDFEMIAISTLLLCIRGQTEAARPVIEALVRALANSKNRKAFIEEATRRGFMNKPSRRENK